MTPKLRGRIQRIAGYSAAFFVAFFFFLYLTFPYGALQRAIEVQARAAGLSVQIASLGPGFRGATAKQVKIAPLPSGGSTEEPPAGVVIDAIAVRPQLFPPGLALHASLFGGKADGSFGLLRKKPSVRVKLGGIDLSRAGMKEAFGADLKGLLRATADLDVDPTDISKATGQIDLDLRDAVISGSLPKINAGEIDGLIKLEAGKATVDHLSVNGEDVEADVDGTITLNPRLLYSAPQLNVKFKLKPAFTERDELAKSIKVILFQQFNANPDSQGFYHLTLEGLLGNPKPRFH